MTYPDNNRAHLSFIVQILLHKWDVTRRRRASPDDNAYRESIVGFYVKGRGHGQIRNEVIAF